MDVAVPARVRAGRAEQNFRRFESDNGGHGARVIVFAEIALSTQDTDRIFADESQIGACDRKSAEIFLDVQVTRRWRVAKQIGLGVRREPRRWHPQRPRTTHIATNYFWRSDP